MKRVVSVEYIFLFLLIVTPSFPTDHTPTEFLDDILGGDDHGGMIFPKIHDSSLIPSAGHLPTVDALIELMSIPTQFTRALVEKLVEAGVVTADISQELLPGSHLVQSPLSKFLIVAGAQKVRRPTPVLETLSLLGLSNPTIPGQFPMLFLNSLFSQPSLVVSNVFHFDLVPYVIEIPTLLCYTLAVPVLLAMEAPVQHRLTFQLSLSIYEASVPFSDDWESFLDTTDRKMRYPPYQQTSLNKKKAAMSACYFFFSQHAPTELSSLSQGMHILGYVPTASPSYGSPEMEGMKAFNRVYEFLRTDGYNSEGKELSAYNGLPYEDYTGYKPVNEHDSPLDYYTFWQPLVEPHAAGGGGKRFGYYVIQSHITPFAGQTRPFFHTAKEIQSNYNSPQYLNCAAELPMGREDSQGITNPENKKSCKSVLRERCERILEIAKVLVDDKKKLLAEFFDNKIQSVAPLGLQLMAIFGLNFDQMISIDLAFTSVSAEATIVAWKEKVRYDGVRPESFVRKHLPNNEFETYVPGVGIRKIKGKDWKPYFRTMPHSEYPSGSACYCTAFAEMGNLLTEGFSIDRLLKSYFPRGSSGVEPGITPKDPFTVEWASWDEIAATCSASRIWSGVHFEESVDPNFGGNLCKGLGTVVFNKMKQKLKKLTMKDFGRSIIE